MFIQDRISGLRSQLDAVVGKDNVRTSEAETAAYSYDSGLSMAQPEAVIFFDSVQQVAPVVKILSQAKIPFIPRMAGTSLTGGTIPLRGGVILNLSRLNKIIFINTQERTVLVETGVLNAELQKALKPFGYFFPPDPASSAVCTIGGNIAENASGPSRIKYGSTGDSVLRLEVVTPDGETHIWEPDGKGPDLMGLVTGSEGTLGIITRAWLKIQPVQAHTCTTAAAFAVLDQAINAASQLMESGLPLSALEIMDKTTLDASLKRKTFLFPHTMRALLLTDISGDNKEETDRQTEQAVQICLDNSSIKTETACEESDRKKLWDIRNRAFPALARIAPDIVPEEACVPRSKLNEAVKKTREVLRKYRLTAGIVISPGTGSIHPHIVFDRRNQQDLRRVKNARAELTKEAIILGGSVAGDYGIGVDKRLALNWLYSTEELDFLAKIKYAFDPFNLSNPDKILPVNNDADLFEEVGRNHNAANLNPSVHTLLATLRNRADNRISSVVCGSGSQIKPPPETEKLKKLDTRFLTMDPVLNKQNRTLKAGAGVEINTLRALLRDNGMELQMPDTFGTIGGIIASGRTPEITRILLGLEAATAEGVYLNFTQQTLKAARGYDISSIFCGSRGAYGIILSVVLQVCLISEKRIFPPAMPVPFRPEPVHRAFKEAVDPENLLNPWLYPGRKEDNK